MDHAALVGVGERVGQRQPDPQHVAVRQLAGGLELREGAAFDQLGDEVAGVVLLARIEQRDDRVVVEPRDRPRLALRAFRRRAAGRDHLDRDRSAEALVARGIDRAEAAGAEPRAEAVAAHGQSYAQLLRGGHVAHFHAREAAPSGCRKGFT